MGTAFCYRFCPSKKNFQASAKVIVNYITVSGVCHTSCLQLLTLFLVFPNIINIWRISVIYIPLSLEVTVKMDYKYLFEIVILGIVCRIFADLLLRDSVGI